VEDLHKELGPYMLRRMKSDVFLNIPSKEEILVEIELTKIQKTYYKAILDKNKEFLSKSATKAKLMNVMMELRKVCNHPFLIRGSEDCIVGQNGNREELLITSCSKFVFLDKLLQRLRQEKRRFE
jgi:SNF2 family DNA or RNA helicase